MNITSNDPELATHIKWYEDGFYAPRIEAVLGKVNDWKNKSVLDIGCGVGTFSIETAKRGASVTAIDSYYESIEIARKIVSKNKLSARVEIVKGSALNLPFNANSFDIIIAADLIEHIGKPNLFLKEVKRVCRNKGLFICATKNALSIYLLLGYIANKNLRMVLPALKSLYKIFFFYSVIHKPDITGTYVGHVNEYDPFRLRRELRKENFHIQYHATYSWNWRDQIKWKRLDRIFYPFFNSKMFNFLKDKPLGLFLGHDQVVITQVNK